MFGPLNGVRVVLVSTACLAAVVAFFIGETWVGLVLMAGIVVHGLGWVYLYRQRAGHTGPGGSSANPIDDGGRHQRGSLP